MTIPEVSFFDGDDEAAAAEELARLLDKLGIESPYVVASVHGLRLASALKTVAEPEAPGGAADQAWAADLGSRAHRAGADAIVAVGGGRCIDVAKLAAARAGLSLVSVPTQLSHDGICSPVAVVPNAQGRSESLGAVEPHAVFLSLPTIAGAPQESLSAGIGDLLANPWALRDWQLAAHRGLEEIDRRAWEMSQQAFERVEHYLEAATDELAGNRRFLRDLGDALILSGVAMLESGTSRPASGGEHEISHAIDHLHGGRALHGAQVAFGCIFSAALYDDDTEALRVRLRRLGLPEHPSDLGLDADQTVEVLLEAPNTRPGRFTIIEATDLDETRARRLVERIWG